VPVVVAIWEMPSPATISVGVGDNTDMVLEMVAVPVPLLPDFNIDFIILMKFAQFLE
jgi:hypothetical protein